MPLDYLHRHSEYEDLIRTVADEKGIAPDLVEKDYWIMHCLYGLTQQGYSGGRVRYRNTEQANRYQFMGPGFCQTT